MNIGGIGGSSFSTVTARPFLPLDKGAVESFAQEMTRRAEQSALPSDAKRTVDANGLDKAMTNAVDYVQENFGDQAARTVMGIVLKRAGNGALNEDSLGQGFVDALEFVDRTFGTASGDKAMAFFNGELNGALNGYFQNGKNESFLAVDLNSATQDLSQTAGDVVSSVMKKFTENNTAPSIMDSALADMKQSLDEAGQKGTQTIAEEMAAKAVDENGFPVAQGQDAPLATTTDGSAQVSSETAQTQAVQVNASTGVRQTLHRRRIASSSAYQKSGLTAGSVVNVSV